MRLLHLISCLGLIITAQADLLAEFTAAGKRDARMDRLAALRVEKGTPPTPFLDPGPFTVTWSGLLTLDQRQRLYFSFEGIGKAELTIDGEMVLSEEGELGTTKSERIRLNPGEHEISIRYESEPDGSARFRLFWEERSFPRQSVPPNAFSVESRPSPLRKGREMFAANHCSKCHLPSSGLGAAPMGEMLEIAPILADTGGRLNQKWLAEWIANPAALKPGTRMPALLDGSTETGRQQAADLAAWLVTLKLSDPPKAPDSKLAKEGGAHFHRLGCVGCHSLPGADSGRERIPLGQVSQKYQPGALVDYLKAPDQWDPHSGMPDFALSDTEASSIAAWLLTESAKITRDEVAYPKGDPARGTELAKQLNCGACHAGLPLDISAVPPLEAIFEKDWSKQGCLTANKTLPKFDLTQEEGSALIKFGETNGDSLKRRVPSEYASRKLEALRCNACHAIDDVRSLLETTHLETEDLVAHIENEDDKLDQSRPHLTYIGEMLHASYIKKVISGTAGPRARPWLDMRMPAFAAHAGDLAHGLAHLQGVEPGAPKPPEIDEERAEIGQTLVGAEGFGCNTCHAIGDTPPTAAFEVQGVDFSLSHQRLRKEWFMRWMDNPRSVTPGTKMPVYSENGESQRTDILDGDAAAQFDAIWDYLLSVSKTPESK